MEETSDSLFLNAWYLDIVSPNWAAVVWGEYDSAFPIPVVTKAGIKQVIQPIFTREFKVLGKNQSTTNLLTFLTSSYKNVNLRLPATESKFDFTLRSHQYINLDDHFESNYSKNAKRLIKKGNNIFTFKVIGDLDEFFKLISDTLVGKIEQFTADNVAILKQLMSAAIMSDNGECIAIYDRSEKFQGAGFFLKNQSRITYLKSAASETAKKNGAMYALINFALNKYNENYSVFDFGGSEIEAVAAFYHKFGAINRSYNHYVFNKLPFWYRWLKKIRLKK
ncbi:MAG: hypothetical protein AB8B72_09895 [Crocinitomicaceae bacterium]